MAIVNEKQKNPWLVLLVLCLGFFMILLDTTIVNVAIPSIITGLRTSLDQVLWVLNAYLLAYAVLLITAGRLGDLWGPRSLFAVGLVVFTLASAACGLAQDTGQLIAARVVQGVGGALLTPQTLTIITSIFPPERRGAAFGIWGGVAGIATITGPTLGGFLVTYVDWRWIFFVNLPVGIVAVVATFLVVPDLRPGRRHRLDLVGVALATAGLFGITFGLVEGQRYDWGTFWNGVTIPEVIAAGVAFLLVFLAWEWYLSRDSVEAEPLVPLRLFQNRNYSITIWISTVIAFGMLGLFLPLTIFLQSVRGMTAFQAGLTFAPMSLMSMLIAPFAGRLVDRIGGKYILLTGLTLFAVGMGLVDVAIGPDAGWQSFFFPALVAGIGMGMTFAPLAAVAMRDIQPQMAGAASGVLNTSRQVGGVVGSAAVGAVLQNRLATGLHDEAVSRAGQLPVPFQQRFVDGFSQAARTGFQVGRGQLGGASLPAGIPPQAAAKLSQVAHDTFVFGFTNAVKPTLLLPLAVILVGAVSCLGIAGRRRSSEQAAVTTEERPVSVG